MNHLVRDSSCGTLLYRLSGRRLFIHEDEKPDYSVPEKYLPQYKQTQANTTKNFHKEEQDNRQTNKIIVTWDGEYDPENPLNWPLTTKIIIVIEIAFLTLSQYIAAAIYTPGVDQMMEEFNCSAVIATVPLSMFVIGYGIGPMFLSPITENAFIGRNPTYISSLLLFFILQIPTALCKSMAGLCVLRLLTGLFASPAVATGGATVGDIVRVPYLPIGIAAWALGGVMGPSLGPFLGGVLVQKGGWRWAFWFMAILSGVCCFSLSWTLPETYGPAILHKKVQRLKKLTGNSNLTSEGEIEFTKLSRRELVQDILYRPFEITFLEPVVMFINIYVALVYSVLFLWFEAFPIVFRQTHHFTLVESGIPYISLYAGVLVGVSIYISSIYKAFTLKILAGASITPEVFIPMAIFAAICMPVGIFIFGWTSSASIHWIGPCIGAAIYAIGFYIMFQTIFNYLGSSFPRYVASVFASNAFIRSMVAGVFPLFARPLFDNLATSKFPVGWGCSILGFLTAAMISIPVTFYLYGPKLRARSKYAN